jgi:hypothetical protein
MRKLLLVPALFLVACTSATAPQSAPKTLESGPKFELNRQDVEAAYKYGHRSDEIAVEALGAGQTVALDASEIEAIADELPAAPLQ